MGTGSVRALVECRDIGRNKLFFMPSEVPVGEMDGVAEFHDLAKKIRPGAKAFKDVWEASSFRVASTPRGVDLGQFTARFTIVNPIYPCHRDPFHWVLSVQQV